MAVFSKEIEEIAKYHVFKEKQSKFRQEHLDAVLDLLEAQLKELRGTPATQHKILYLYECALYAYKLKGR